ncbi:NAD(P)H-dependent oxidoreductase [Noviherbaspirillum massiliense]|uniref:NAD(P)H-dependent oxidoreductase n=1 Tax=Noviherbaspirillum massiliense TaxID=1465823 RepID=UPI000312826B|nr:Gfo/Idh/MocA family oxidoreductase [Noviherbaspirillum massiliense]
MTIQGLNSPIQSMSVYHLLQAREAERRPIRVGVIGAGATGRAIALQLGTPVPGMRLAAISNRTPEHAERSFREAGIRDWQSAQSAAAAEAKIARGIPVLTDDPQVLTRCGAIDLIVEVTGTVDFGASVVLDAIAHGKDVVMVNAELDSLVGPILKARADQAGVVLTHTDGDEPGVAMTLFRYVQSVGLRPVAAGNIKGMVDHYRTPDTQRSFAEKHDQDVRKVTSFADATKLSMETCVLANATGFGVGRRGMYGPACGYVRELAKLLPPEAMLSGGIVDYSVGAAPHTGGFVIVHEENPYKQTQLAYYKLGDGPFYVFYTPYHLPHIQLPSTIARAALHRDATVAPIAGPSCEVVAVAKRDLKAGERLDGVGGFCAYGLIENHRTAREANALPIAMSDDCVLLRDISRDEVISFDDVRMPPRRLVDDLWQEQMRRWPLEARSGAGRGQEAIAEALI